MKRMKNKKSIELDVDFIGGESELTKEETLAISAFIRESKLKSSKEESLKKSGSTNYPLIYENSPIKSGLGKFLK